MLIFGSHKLLKNSTKPSPAARKGHYFHQPYKPTPLARTTSFHICSVTLTSQSIDIFASVSCWSLSEWASLHVSLVHSLLSWTCHLYSFPLLSSCFIFPIVCLYRSFFGLLFLSCLLFHWFLFSVASLKSSVKVTHVRGWSLRSEWLCGSSFLVGSHCEMAIHLCLCWDIKWVSSEAFVCLLLCHFPLLLPCSSWPGHLICQSPGS